MGALSLRAYSRHRGCALNAVQEAIRSGRLKGSLVRSGKGWRIRDAAAADAEWAATTHASKVPLTGPSAPKNRSPSPPSDGDIPNLAEARARLDLAKAELAEMELAERRGELLPAQDVEARLVDEFSSCKTKLLGIPSRARQQDPALTAEQLDLIEKLIREALEGLAADETPAPRRARAAR